MASLRAFAAFFLCMFVVAMVEHANMVEAQAACGSRPCCGRQVTKLNALRISSNAISFIMMPNTLQEHQHFLAHMSITISLTHLIAAQLRDELMRWQFQVESNLKDWAVIHIISILVLPSKVGSITCDAQLSELYI
ncbi:hypothetical protein SELMODRAFT_406253 [Selaginella moellendorffii]|uniref:Uncharacterized protein n=1 Tax=Selaginella moellendorffii TaxID=88036 RepID=D8R1S3_SELML|nr:hypothetical protein SELMODRAFT_406253 [Selaginella moellendorffii]